MKNVAYYLPIKTNVTGTGFPAIDRIASFQLSRSGDFSLDNPVTWAKMAAPRPGELAIGIVCCPFDWYLISLPETPTAMWIDAHLGVSLVGFNSSLCLCNVTVCIEDLYPSVCNEGRQLSVFRCLELCQTCVTFTLACRNLRFLIAKCVRVGVSELFVHKGTHEPWTLCVCMCPVWNHAAWACAHPIRHHPAPNKTRKAHQRERERESKTFPSVGNVLCCQGSNTHL